MYRPGASSAPRQGGCGARPGGSTRKQQLSQMRQLTETLLLHISHNLINVTFLVEFGNSKHIIIIGTWYIHVYVYICVYIYVYTHIHTYTRTHLCVYIYIYTRLHRSGGSTRPSSQTWPRSSRGPRPETK